MFNQKMNKFSNSYDYKSKLLYVINKFINIGKTMNEKVRQQPKDTIEEDEIKEEINVVEDDSDDNNSQENLRKRFMDRLKQQKPVERQSKTSNLQK